MTRDDRARYLATACLAVIALSLGFGMLWGVQIAPTALDVAFLFTVTVVPSVVGFLVVRRHPRHAVGWLLLAHGLLTAPNMAADTWSEFAARQHTHLWGAALEQQLSQAVWPNLYVCIMLVAYLYPDGHFLTARWRRWVLVCLAGYAAFEVAATFEVAHLEGKLRHVAPPLPRPPTYVTVPFVVVGLLLISASLVGAVVCARRRTKRVTGDQRRQMLWFAWSALSVPAGLALCWVDALFLGETGSLTIVGVIITTSVLPIGVGIGILRPQLFDIEVVLSRTLSYGALTALVAGIYAAVLLGVGALLDNQSVAGFLGVAVVAVAIQPVQARLRRRIDRWVYGDRSDPYAALRRLSDRLEAAVDPAQAIAIVTSSVAEALRVERVSVQLDGETADGAGTNVVRVPLVHQDTRLGDLVVDVPRGRQLSAVDRQMLDDLARHAAVIVNAIHLTLDLQHSRARIVTAREEERRRLRRDLHDGVGPVLAAMVLKLNVLGATVDDPSSTELLTELREETKAAIGEIRRLVDDLRPPALDEVGLVGALRQKAVSLSAHGGDQPLVVEVEAPAALPQLSAAAEVAAYRIAMEAVTNVVRHSGATRCVVSVTADRTLEVTVSDNGGGMRGPARPGVGLTSMHERAGELGGTCTVTTKPEGGTVVHAVIPLPRRAGTDDTSTVPSQPVDLGQHSTVT
jgi:signal transduction histidine kinase